MAGIILCLGDEAGQDIERIRYNFESCKGLQASYVFRDNKCQVVKYQRKYDLKDNNWFESPEVMVCAVGTVLYQIYNFEDSIKEVGKSLSKGEKISKIVDRLNGTFCLIIISKNERKCYIITDPGGVINAYVIRRNKTLFISTSMLALARTFNVTPDSKSILMFMRTGMFFDDTTYFNEISALKPASSYEYDIDMNMDQLERREYWRVPQNVVQDISLAHSAHNLKKALFHIIDKIPNETSMYDFTGGYDSRFVLAFAYSKAKIKKRINAFFFGPPISREAKIVRNNCINLGITYNNYLLPNDWTQMFFDYVLEANSLSDGMISAFEYAPVLWIQKEKRKLFKYSVTGNFGEIYRGFTAKQEFLMTGKRRRADIPRFIRFRNLAGSFEHRIFSLKSAETLRQIPVYLRDCYDKTNSGLDDHSPNTLQLDNIYFAHRMRRWGGKTISTTNQIIQAVCPLWYREALTVCFSLPPHIKLREKLMKHIVCEIAPDISAQKTISGAPFSLVNSRNIIRFVPAVIFYSLKAIRKIFEVVFKRSILGELTLPSYNVGKWYREALNDPRCKDLLDYNKMVSRGFYDKEQFERFIQQAKSTKFSFYTQLGHMITVELTLRYVNLRSEVDGQVDRL